MPIDENLDWKVYFWVRRGSRRKRVLKFVNESANPVTATMVRKALQMPITNSTATLIQLSQKKLIKCLNPKKYHGKQYLITKIGEIICKRMQC